MKINKKYTNMRGDKTHKILRALGEASGAMEDLFAIFSMPYGTSMGKMQAKLDKERARREFLEAKTDERRKFTYLMYNLKRSGLVADSGGKGDKSFKLTSKGKDFLRKLRWKRGAPARSEGDSGHATTKIVIFDVPEKKRRYRRWLREVLSGFGFTMLQKSVWAGKVKLPEDFLVDLKDMGLMDCVEIFSIGESGTLEKVK